MSLENYAIIDSTLREGEQFINAQFSRDQKVRIAHALRRVRRRVSRAHLAASLARQP